MNSSYLEHYGVKGQKWGVRRYQNPDGTLTEAGKKKLSKTSGDKLYKQLKKDVQKQRKQIHGAANQWGRLTPIGDSSRKLIEDRRKLERDYENTKEYKDWNKKYDDFLDKYEKEFDETGWFDQDEYDRIDKELWDQKPKKNFNTLHFAHVSGKGYVDDYCNKGGKDLSMAYLKDLGWDEKTSERFVKKMAMAKKTLADS